MESFYKKEDKQLIFEINEDIDECVVQKIRRKLDNEIERYMPKEVVFDFNKVSFMDSAGIGLIIGRYKLVDMLGGKVKVTNLTTPVRKIFEMSGILRIIPEIKNENIEALERGFNNLLRHVDNLKNKYGLNVIVAINKYTHDTEREIEFLRNKLKEYDIELSLVESWEKGGEGATDLAEKIVKLTEKNSKLNYAYNLNKSIKEKINDVATKIYGAEGVEFSQEAEEMISRIEKMGYGNLPVCIAKTQYSFSDDPKNLECTEPFKIHVKEIILKSGAEFVVAITGKIMTMPGLPRVPAAEQIDLDADGNIVGIF